MTQAKAARDAAHAVLTSEQDIIARIQQAAAKHRKHLAAEQLSKAPIDRLRTTTEGVGLSLVPFRAAGLLTVGQLIQRGDRLEHLPGVGPATAARTKAAIAALAKAIEATVEVKPDPVRRGPHDTTLLLELARLQHLRDDLGPVLPAAREICIVLNPHLAAAHRATRRLAARRSTKQRALYDTSLAAVVEAMESDRLRPAVEAVLSAHSQLTNMTVTEQLWEDYRRRPGRLHALLAEANGAPAKPSPDLPPGMMRCLIGLALVVAALAPLFKERNPFDGTAEQSAMRIVALLVGVYLVAWGRWAWSKAKWAAVSVPGAVQVQPGAGADALKTAPGFGRVLFGLVWLYLTIIPPDDGVFAGDTTRDVVKIIWIVVSGIALTWGMLARTTRRGRNRQTPPDDQALPQADNLPAGDASPDDPPAGNTTTTDEAALAAVAQPDAPVLQTPAPEPAPEEQAATVTTHPTYTPTPPATHPARWVPAGQPVQVDYLTIGGGLLYVGQGLFADGMAEPSLIDPAQPINYRQPDWSGDSPYHVPSYAQLTPGARAAYLTWLGDGRRYPQAPTGFALLLLYGLERRVLLDLGNAPDPATELTAVADQVIRLLSVYNTDRAFVTQAAQFLLLLRALQDRNTPQLPRLEPPTAGDLRPVPLSLRLALAAYAATGTPLPADWALAWTRHHPTIHAASSTTSDREFAKLFTSRYTQRFGPGLRVIPGHKRVALPYRPANPALARQRIMLAGWPDVYDSPGLVAQLAELTQSIHLDRQPYDRSLAHNPPAPHNPPAAELLPNEPSQDDKPDMAALRQWAERHLRSRPTALVDGAELTSLWPNANSAGLRESDFVTLVQLLGRSGFGIEPDLRFGHTEITDVAVLFRTEAGEAQTPSTAYTAAATLLRLAVTVSAADGTISTDEREHLVAHLRDGLQLTRAEQVRLEAHLRWLIASGTRLAGIKDRLKRLTAQQSEKIGRFLVTVAAADGVISADEVSTLQRIYDLLGLPHSMLSEQLHSATARTQPQQLTPAPVATQPPTAATPRTADALRLPVGPGLALDADALATKLRETASVAALLTSVFSDDEGPAVEPARRPAVPAPPRDDTSPAVGLLPGLDAAHHGLLAQLLTRPAWPRPDFDALAAQHGLMPDGAIEVLNEAAYEAFGDPLIDDDGDLIINEYALKETTR
ncbi:TerB N-terminal domain-containing protein [Catellatospora chokoriensis]|uniref:tellurite resistance TerB family protein n=1 Tax=Catellatospora chokoriensis TaxID=310353 RepID=UPI0017868F59|nr:TerB N-terminal domain-containing protein [Catellatospora chokoriensis]